MLDIEKFSMHPSVTLTILQILVKQKDRYDLKVPSLSFSNFRLDRFSEDECLPIQKDR